VPEPVVAVVAVVTAVTFEGTLRRGLLFMADGCSVRRIEPQGCSIMSAEIFHSTSALEAVSGSCAGGTVADTAAVPHGAAP
jgi:hypothetical protein